MFGMKKAYRDFYLLFFVALLCGTSFFAGFGVVGISFADRQEADAREMSGGEKLKKYGFISGGTNGDLMPERKLTRQELAVIICSLYGKKIEADRFRRPPIYKDAYRFAEWSKSYISYCQYMGWMVGRSGDVFDHAGAVSADDLSNVILRALDYREERGRAALESLGVSVPVGNALTREQAFEVLWQAVSKPIMKNGKSLGEFTGRLDSAPASFGVSELRSDNLGYLVAEFTKFVDSASVGKNSIILTDLSTRERIPIGSVKVEKSRVFFIPETPFRSVRAYCEIRDINSDWGESDRMPPFQKHIQIVDTSAPKMQRAEISGEKAITLVFDEPISKVGNLRLKSGNVYISVATSGVAGLMTDRLTFAVHSTLQEGKTYVVETSGFKDLVGKAGPRVSTEAVSVRSAELPSVRVGAQTSDCIELIFSKPVNGVDASKFYHTGPEKKPIKVTTVSNYQAASISKKDYVDRVYLWFYHPSSDRNFPVPTQDSVFVIDERGITDGFNQPLKSGTYSVKASDPLTPKVEFVEFVSSGKLRIGFTGVLTAPTLEVKDGKGNRLALSPLTKAPSKVYEYRVSGELSAESVFVGISGAKESRAEHGREVTPHHVHLRIGDAVLPTVTAVRRSVKGGMYYLEVKFSEAVDESALQLSNYQLVIDNTLKTFTGKAEFFADQTGVRMTLPEADYKELVLPSNLMFITGIKDLAGNQMAGVRKEIGDADE